MDAEPTCDENNHGYYVSWASVGLFSSGVVATIAAFQFRGQMLRLQAEQEIVGEIEQAGQTNGEEPLLSENDGET